MAIVKHPIIQWFFLGLFFAALLMKDATGTRVQVSLHEHPTGISLPKRETNIKVVSKRLLIGSVAPTCTYNECRGCKYKCRAEQVPVEGNDPINSAYHYKCVCHSGRGPGGPRGTLADIFPKVKQNSRTATGTWKWSKSGFMGSHGAIMFESTYFCTKWWKLYHHDMTYE